MKDIVVIYHAQCQDGFGAAYSAWKKFGDSASYIPLTTQTAMPEGLTDRTIYIVDYSFDLEILTGLRASNRSVVVIDHHQTGEAAVTAFPENVFDLNHSGAVLTWHYFYPDLPVPKLLLYIEDTDLWRFTLPHHRAVGAMLTLEPRTFERFDELATLLDNETFFASYIEKGVLVARAGDSLVTELLTYRERVQFEEHTIYAVNIGRPHRSIVGHHLARLSKAEGGVPLGIVYYRNRGAVHISLRSEDDIDVATIAERYGGGGHKHAASIRVDSFADLPFTFL